MESTVKKDIIILGASGLGIEIAWLIEEINDEKKQWNLIWFPDPHPFVQKKELIGYPVLGPYSLIKIYLFNKRGKHLPQAILLSTP